MKRVFIIIAGLLSLQFAWAQPKPSTTVAMTLQQCIEFAKENNPNLKNSQIAIKAAEARVGETLSIGLPQVTGTADLGSNFIIPTSFFPALFSGDLPENMCL